MSREDIEFIEWLRREHKALYAIKNKGAAVRILESKIREREEEIIGLHYALNLILDEI